MTLPTKHLRKGLCWGWRFLTSSTKIKDVLGKKSIELIILDQGIFKLLQHLKNKGQLFLQDTHKTPNCKVPNPQKMLAVFRAFQTGKCQSWPSSLSPHVCSSFGYLDHEVFTETPARLGAFLSQGTHVVFKAAKVLSEGHEEKRSQLKQQRIPGFLRPRWVLQRIWQNHTPTKRGQ